MSRMVMAYTLFLLAAGAAVAQPPQAKVPVPDAASQKAAHDRLLDIYKSDLDAARLPEQKLELAKNLLRVGSATKDDLAGQYVVLDMAKELAADRGDVGTALEAVSQIAMLFDIDALATKAAVAEKAARSVRLSKDSEFVLPKIIGLVDELVAADRYDLAKSLSKCALTTAKSRKDVKQLRGLSTRIQEIDETAKEFTNIQPALATLAAAPNDPVANLSVGKFRCFSKGDWENGLPLLLLGSDKALSDLAVREVSDTPDSLALGDRWWEIADMQTEGVKLRIEKHAAVWYAKALPALSGLTKVKVEKRLHEVEAAFPDPLNWLQAFDVTSVQVVGGSYVRIMPDHALVSKDQPQGPLEVTLVARTDSSNIRIEALKGSVIWNWEKDETQLRVVRPGKFQGMGTPADDMVTARVLPLKRNEWHTLQWVVTGTSLSVFTDGQLVLREPGRYVLPAGPIRVYGAFGSIIDAKSVVVRHLRGE